MKLQELANQVRETPLCDLLQWHGFEIKSEGVTFRAKNDRHSIFVTGNRWFDNKAGLGGLGAIDLQMHLTGEDFTAACQTLQKDFQGISPAEIGLSFPIERHIRSGQERRPFHELAARYAVPNEANWPIARAYLVETRGMNPSLWTTCMRWERFSPTTTARIQASFSSTGRSTERSRERHYETRGSNPPFVRAWETSSRLVQGRPSRSDPRMIVAAASQAQRSSDFIMRIEHKESLQECQTSLEGKPLTWAREQGIDTRIPGFAYHDQDGDGVSTLMEWKHGTSSGDRLSRPHRQCLSL
jgi:hypothetical protein